MVAESKTMSSSTPFKLPILDATGSNYSSWEISVSAFMKYRGILDVLEHGVGTVQPKTRLTLPETITTVTKIIDDNFIEFCRACTGYFAGSNTVIVFIHRAEVANFPVYIVEKNLAVFFFPLVNLFLCCLSL